MIIYVVYRHVNEDTDDDPIVSLHLSLQDAVAVVKESLDNLAISEQTIGMDTYPNA